MARDPYQELGVPRTATSAEVRKAFHKLAKANDPDTNPGNKPAEERFKKVSAAFDIVGDAAKRKKFDAGELDNDGRETAGGFGGAGGRAGSWGAPGGGGPGRGGSRGETFEGGDLGDILGEMFGGRGPRGGGGGSSGFGGFAQRGTDVRAKIEIDLVDAIRGGKQRIAFTDGRTIDITIPKGAQDGQTLRLKGQGGPGRGGAGDAFIEIAILSHALYRREAGDLVMDLPVAFYDAVLGGKVDAPTPDGPVTLTVPKAANTGTRLRLKGRGLADPQGKRGDLFARIVVTLPDAVDPDLDAFADRYRKDHPYTPRRRA